jgi:hypothetical protein
VGYPDISFAIEDFGSAFKSLVSLAEERAFPATLQCYRVAHLLDIIAAGLACHMPLSPSTCTL